MRAIHSAFMGSVLVYIGVAWLVTHQVRLERTLEPAGARQFAIVLGLVWVATLAALPILGRSLREHRAFLLIRLAMFESGALYGLALTLMSREANYMLAFGICALMLMATTSPD